MTDYATGADTLRATARLTRPEKWLALRRYDLVVAQDLTKGGKAEVRPLAARAAFEGAFGLAIVSATPLSLVFMMAVFFGPETDNYLPHQIVFGAVAVILFVVCYLRGRAAQRHIQRGD